MRTARSIALAAVVAGAVPGCAEPEIMARAPCEAALGPDWLTAMPALASASVWAITPATVTGARAPDRMKGLTTVA